jgi:hypothetical protein
MAVKYYKGTGSYFQTQILTMDEKKKELYFPFSYYDEKSIRNDIFGKGSELIPFNKSLDIKDIPKYMENSYKTRITLFNRLDKIYDKPTCPRMTGNEVLFRGMISFPAIEKLKVGDKYTFKNFISTTDAIKCINSINRNLTYCFTTLLYIFLLRE